jgi:hypothetical protein
VIEGARRVVKPRRFKIKLSIGGRVWRSVDVEVAADEGSAGAGVDVLRGASLEHFGPPSPTELTGIVLDYQVAQKLHACTDPHDPPALLNDRVRDLIDLTLVREAFYVAGDLATLRVACEDLFRSRAAEAITLDLPPRPWPPLVPAHDHWRTDFDRLANDVGIVATIDAVVADLNSWVTRISSA